MTYFGSNLLISFISVAERPARRKRPTDSHVQVSQSVQLI